MIYDNIIIGAGIAGLYTVYMLLQKNPNQTFIILEENSKKDIGGRIVVNKFHGVDVLGGAGIGRFNKDTLLKNLLDELKISYNKFTISSQFSKTFTNPVEVLKTFKFLKKEYIKNKKDISFKEFAISKLGVEEYNNFRKSTAYSDFENEDVHDTLYYYGMDDNTTGWIGMSIPWLKLLDKMKEKIGIKNIVNDCKVTKITKINDNVFTIDSNINQYYGKKIWIATTIDSIKKLLKNPEQKLIYNQIKGQPFLRVYAKFSGESKKIMKQFVNITTIVPTSIYRIIPMSNDVYMVVYSDNRGANFMNNLINNDNKKYENLANFIKNSLGISKDFNLIIDDLIVFYWKIGTHFYKPLSKDFKSRIEFINKAQHPDKNIYIVGEVVSINQGWVEGSLESVHKLLK